MLGYLFVKADHSMDGRAALWPRRVPSDHLVVRWQRTSRPHIPALAGVDPRVDPQRVADHLDVPRAAGGAAQAQHDVGEG